MNVIVVGAGPTGLLLAGDLAEAGVPVTVVEQRPHRISNLTRAFAVHARTLEQLDMRGLAEEVEAAGRPIDQAGFLASISVDLRDLPSRFRHVLVVAQYEVEKALERRAEQAGVRFRYDAELTGVTQDSDGVTAVVRGPDGAVESLRAAWLVGADGVRSKVREAIGMPFPGRTVLPSVCLGDVKLAERPGAVITASAVGDLFAFLVPFQDGYYRVICWDRSRDVPQSEPVELAELKDITRRVLGTDYGMYDARWASRFHSDERQVPSYRRGRVFLAGDAAHVHTPAGGQGLNTGMQDAANLSWKLAAVIQGHADTSLLDTYQTERHPVGRDVVRSSGALVRLAMARRPWTLALRYAVAFTVNFTAPVRRKAIGQVTGIGIGYRRTAPRGAHRLVGVRVPDVALESGRLYEALRGGRFVLITPRTNTPEEKGSWGGEGRGGKGRLAVGHWANPDRRTTLLVRPDGYVAWASDTSDEAAVEGALATYVG